MGAKILLLLLLICFTLPGVFLSFFYWLTEFSQPSLGLIEISGNKNTFTEFMSRAFIWVALLAPLSLAYLSSRLIGDNSFAPSSRFSVSVALVFSGIILSLIGIISVGFKSINGLSHYGSGALLWLPSIQVLTMVGVNKARQNRPAGWTR